MEPGRPQNEPGDLLSSNIQSWHLLPLWTRPHPHLWFQWSAGDLRDYVIQVIHLLTELTLPPAGICHPNIQFKLQVTTVTSWIISRSRRVAGLVTNNTDLHENMLFWTSSEEQDRHRCVQGQVHGYHEQFHCRPQEIVIITVDDAKSSNPVEFWIHKD